MCNDITYPFPNLNSCFIKVWEWINNFTPHFIMDVISYPYCIHILQSFSPARCHLADDFPIQRTLLRFGLTVWMSNYTHHKVSDDITYPFPMLNWAATEVWELISYFIPHVIVNVVANLCWDQSILINGPQVVSNYEMADKRFHWGTLLPVTCLFYTNSFDVLIIPRSPCLQCFRATTGHVIRCLM